MDQHHIVTVSGFESDLLKNKNLEHDSASSDQVVRLPKVRTFRNKESMVVTDKASSVEEDKSNTPDSNNGDGYGL